MRLQRKKPSARLSILPRPTRSEVDNIFGSIDVVGGTSDQVQLVVNKTIFAESKEKMEAARKKSRWILRPAGL
jgi:hypothetical protein